jgi:hypothetical protein
MMGVGGMDLVIAMIMARARAMTMMMMIATEGLHDRRKWWGVGRWEVVRYLCGRWWRLEVRMRMEMAVRKMVRKKRMRMIRIMIRMGVTRMTVGLETMRDKVRKSKTTQALGTKSKMEMNLVAMAVVAVRAVRMMKTWILLAIATLKTKGPRGGVLVGSHSKGAALQEREEIMCMTQ